jgi:two-component sensor histidine kinase
LILPCIKESGKRRQSKLEDQSVRMEEIDHTAKNVVEVLYVVMGIRNIYVKNVVEALFAVMEDRNHIVKNVVEVLSVHMESRNIYVKNVVVVYSVHMER